MNTAAVMALLRQRYAAKAGKPAEWLFLTEVPEAPGFDSRVRADAVALGLWPSRGLPLHGFEVKVSRPDWRRELENPAKAEAFARHCDYWWVVAGEQGLVHSAELPLGWGLLFPRGGRLVVGVEAARREPAPVWARPFAVALARAAMTEHWSVTADMRDGLMAETRAAVASELELAQASAAEWRGLVERFERAAGVRLRDFFGGGQVERVAAALRLVLEGEDQARDRVRQLRYMRDQARWIGDEIERVLVGVDEGRGAWFSEAEMAVAVEALVASWNPDTPGEEDAMERDAEVSLRVVGEALERDAADRARAAADG